MSHPESPAPEAFGTTSTTAPARRGLVGYLIWLAVMTSGAYAWYYFHEQQAPASRAQHHGGENRPAAVVTATATVGVIHVYLSGLGTVTPQQTVTVRSRVDGQLNRVLFREGQFVEAGELLAEIDPRPYEVQRTQAEGAMARDQALLANARTDLQRYRGLYRQDSVPQQQVATQEALVRQYEGNVRADQGQIDSARLQLDYTHITAPISGRVGFRLVDAGNIVHASDVSGLVVIAQLKPISVLFSVPESDLPAVLNAMKGAEQPAVDARTRAGTTTIAHGTLLTVDNQIDTTTGTVRLKASFPNDDLALFPNQFVNARLLVETRAGVTLVPDAAVQHGTPGTFVYLVRSDQTVEVRTVQTGPNEAGMTVIERGLAPGDRVVTEGTDKLRDGSQIEWGQDAEAAASTPGGRHWGTPAQHAGEISSGSASPELHDRPRKPRKPVMEP